MKKINIARLQTLIKLLDCPADWLTYFLKQSRDSFYKTALLKKPNGEFRIISKPIWKLKLLQTKIRTLLSRQEMPSCVHGWVKGRSIKTALIIHKNMPHFYAFDIKSYFDSVTNSHVYRLFTKHLNCTPKIAEILTQLVTYKAHLPQGSPCSPIIANLVLQDFDVSLENYCRKKNIRYSRFGDDLLISSNFRLKKIQTIVVELLRRKGLKINEQKIVKNISLNKTGVKALGLTLGHKISVPRKYRREVGAILVNARKTGLEAQNRKNRYNFRQHLKGRINLIKMFHQKEGEKLNKMLQGIPDELG